LKNLIIVNLLFNLKITVMKKVFYVIGFALAIFIVGCSNNKGFTPTYKGMIEGDGDWININTIGKYYGHTGDYCSRVDSNNVYSFGFRKSITEISSNPIKKVKISVWVKLDDINKKTSLVVSVVGKDGKNIFWNGHDVNPVVKEAGKWYKFEVEETLPEFDGEGAHIETYLNNPNKNVAYVDDFEIKFSEE
jgi:hypothetical protein